MTAAEDGIRKRPLRAKRSAGADARRESLLRDLDARKRRDVADPDDTTNLLSLGLCYRELGRLDADRDVRAAREWCLRELRVRERLVDLAPAETWYATGLASSCNRLARLLAPEDAEMARVWYVRALEIRERLAEVEPDDREAGRHLADACERLGRLDGRRDPVRGRTWHLKALAIRERLAEAEPGNADLLLDVAFAHHALAKVEERLDRAEALRRWELWLKTVEFCVALDAGNGRFTTYLALALEDVGIARFRRSLEGAEAPLRKAVEIWRSLASLCPSEGGNWEALAGGCHLLETLLFREGRKREAAILRKEFRAALGQARRLLGATTARLEYLRACDDAVHGAPARALAALERAARFGGGDAEELLAATDLASLRGTPRFRAVFEALSEGYAEPAG